MRQMMVHQAQNLTCTLTWCRNPDAGLEMLREVFSSSPQMRVQLRSSTAKVSIHNASPDEGYEKRRNTADTVKMGRSEHQERGEMGD